MPSALRQATFIGLDDGEYISDHVEAIINLGSTRGDRTLDVLERALMNITGDIVYDFTSMSGSATQIGLPIDVVQLTPWRGVSNSAVETDLPGNILDDLRDVFNTVVGAIADGVKLVVGGLIALSNFIYDVFEAVVDWGMGVVGVISAVVQAVKHAIMYAIVILGYLMKVFMNGVLATMFASFALIDQLPIGDYFSTNLSWNNYLLGINFSGLVIEADIGIVNQYVPTFDLELPSIQFDLGIAINGVNTQIIASSGLIAIWQNEFDISSQNNNQNLSLMSQNSVNDIQTNSVAFNPTIFGFGATLADVLHLALAGVVSYGITTENDLVSMGSFIGLMYGHIGILGASLARYNNNYSDEEIIFNSSLGQAFALIGLSIMLFLTQPQYLDAIHLKLNAATAISTVGTLLTTWGFFIQDNDSISLTLTVMAEIFSGIGVLRSATLSQVKSGNKATTIWYSYTIDLFLMGMSMIGLAGIAMI